MYRQHDARLYSLRIDLDQSMINDVSSMHVHNATSEVTFRWKWKWLEVEMAFAEVTFCNISHSFKAKQQRTVKCQNIRFECVPVHAALQHLGPCHVDNTNVATPIRPDQGCCNNCMQFAQDH